MENLFLKQLEGTGDYKSMDQVLILYRKYAIEVNFFQSQSTGTGWRAIKMISYLTLRWTTGGLKETQMLMNEQKAICLTMSSFLQATDSHLSLIWTLEPEYQQHQNWLYCKEQRVWINFLSITPTLNYWKNHYDASISDIDNIDSDSGAAAIKQLPPSKWQWAANFATGFIGNNHMRAKRGEMVLPTCPLCYSAIEKNFPSSLLLKCWCHYICHGQKCVKPSKPHQHQTPLQRPC